MSLARAGRALPRGVERRPRVDGTVSIVQPLIAAAVRRQVGARVVADAERSRPSATATTSSASTGWQAAIAPAQWRSAAARRLHAARPAAAGRGRAEPGSRPRAAAPPPPPPTRTARCARSRRSGGVAARRVHRGSRSRAPVVQQPLAATRRPAAPRPPSPASSQLPARPARSTTAASPTTPGCRSCRSRSPS